MGTVGPGAIHLLNGLYDAKKSHAPVLAICGQVPREEMGSEFFQEVDNDALFADVSVFNQTVTSVDQLPGLIEQAGNAALQLRGVAVLTLPGDVGGLDLPKHTPVPRFVADLPAATPSRDSLRAAAAAINAADRVTLLVGQGARHARAEVLELAGRLQAPMVLTLKAKEGLEEGNPYEVGQSGLIGNRATKIAFDGCDLLFLVGTDFPYKDFLPHGKTVVQLDVRGTHIGRRTPVDHPLVGDSRLGLEALLPMLEAKDDRALLEKSRKSYQEWREHQQRYVDPGYDRKPVGLLRRKVDNPEARVRPELLAAMVDRYAADDAVFTTDTGMSTVWLSRFVRMTGHPAADRLLQPRLDGQRDAAGARRRRPRPVAPGRRVLRRRRALDAAGRPDHRGLPRPAGQARRLRQRPARDGEARDGAGRAPGVRHRAAQPGLRPGRRGHGDARASGSRTRTTSRRRSARRWRTTVRCCSTCSPTPTRSPCRPSRRWSRAGASRSPRAGSSSTALNDRAERRGRVTPPRFRGLRGSVGR